MICVRKRDGLLEHAVLTAQTIARSWELHRGHRVEKASREAAQASGVRVTSGPETLGGECRKHGE